MCCLLGVSPCTRWSWRFFMNGRQTGHNGIGHCLFQFPLPIHFLFLHGLSLQLLITIVHNKLLDEHHLGIAVTLCRTLFGQPFLLFVQWPRLHNHLLQLQARITVQMIFGRFKGRFDFSLQNTAKINMTKEGGLLQFLL